MKFVYHLESILRTFTWVLSGICLVLMMLHTSIDVGMRLIIGKPPFGTIEIVSSYYMVAVAFLPLALIQHHKKHISVDVLDKALNNHTKYTMDIINNGIMSIFFLGLFWQSTLQAIKSTKIGESVDLVHYDLPTWPTRWIIPMACISILLTLALEMYRTIHNKQPSTAQ